jgi:negative regulator of flagellin synthesis FlgM
MPNKKGHSKAAHNTTAGKHKAGKGKPAPTGQNVTFTQAAAELKDIEQRLIDESAVDPERVSRMKQELASGNYCIDTNRVADKMIELEKLLKR